VAYVPRVAQESRLSTQPESQTQQTTQPKKGFADRRGGRYAEKVELFSFKDRKLLNQARKRLLRAWQSEDTTAFIEAENHLRKVLKDAKANKRKHENLHAQHRAKLLLSSVEGGVSLQHASRICPADRSEV